MAGQYIIIAIIAGAFVAGIGAGFAIFTATYSPYHGIMQGPMFYSMVSQNPQLAGQYMSYMMQSPQLRQQMYGYMFQDRDFMNGMMGNPGFQSQYMGPWMMQNPQFQKQWSRTAPPVQPNGTASPQYIPQQGPGVNMGPGMMSGGYGYGQPIRTITVHDAESAGRTAGGGAVTVENNTISFSSQSVSIMPLSFMAGDARNFTGMSPPAYAKDDVFVIGNMIDPTIVLRPGTVLSVTLVNLDSDMSHNFAIMSKGPPYPYMAMQEMMYGGMVATMPVLPNYDESGGIAYEYGYSVTLSQPGTYWYACTYPGHAQDGMYGKIIVQ